jgi:hypothetical protein
MQELIARLMNALNAGGPSSADVQQVLQQINAQFPAQADLAKAIVSGWTPRPATPSQPASSSSGIDFTSWKFIAPVLAALGLGTGAGAGINTQGFMDFVKTLPLPTISNRWELLGLVAVVGAVVGFAYSFYRNNWTIILPTFARNQAQFQVASWGFLRNLVMAAVVSVATTWLAFSSNPTPPTGGNLLTWTVVMSAIAAGLVGSRMASGEVEKSVLWEALSTSAEKAAVPGLGKLVDDAKTALDAAAIATGRPVPGVNPPKEMSAARGVPEIEADLLKLFDRPALKAWLLQRGTPIGNDGKGVILGILDVVQPLKSTLKTALKDLEVVPVAGMSPDAFRAELDKRGIETSNFKDLFDDVHTAAARAVELFLSLPVGWSLPPDRV